MMKLKMRRSKAYLKDMRLSTLVDAALVEEPTRPYVLRAQAHWAAFTLKNEVRDKEHLHWNWTNKFLLSTVQKGSKGYAVECDKQAQGLMLTRSIGFLSRISRGAPLVYIESLATAPWNLPPHCRYGMAGTFLLATAVRLSLNLGYRGRIALHSLPQAEGFYTFRKMRGFMADPKKENLVYFEMTPDAAQKFVESKKAL